MANLSKSTEIRWFLKGAIPNMVNDWFNSFATSDKYPKEMDGEEREDLYLLCSGANHITPKLRQGRFEIKLLSDSNEIFGIRWQSYWQGRKLEEVGMEISRQRRS